jgi:elongation factor Ts
MNKISASLVKELREATGAGMMDCKEALAETNGSIDLAIEVLRKKGLKSLSKRAGKSASEGTIGSYTHAGDQIACIVELNCETDFVARGEEFKALARGLAMHVAAMNPQYLVEGDVPAEVVEKEKEIAFEQLTDVQKESAETILQGKVRKFFEETVLLNQNFIMDKTGKQTVSQALESLSVKVGEKVAIRRFLRYEVGEGIEKEVVNLADDVAAMTGVM